MRNLSLIALLSIAPSLGAAQTTVSGSAETKTNAGVRAGRTQASAEAETRTAATVSADRPQWKPDSAQQRTADRARALRGLSAEGRARAEAVFRQGQRDSVPEHPLIAAMLEARAKGAAESRILAVQHQTLTRLKASKEAMVRAGRSNPSDEEVSRGANVLARGATAVQLEGLVRRCPSDRSLVVAFETLTHLTARGVPIATAMAEIGARLEGRASDEAIRSLDATLTADAAAGARVGPSGVDAGAGAATSAGTTVGRTLGGSATGGIGGSVSGGLLGR